MACIVDETEIERRFRRPRRRRRFFHPVGRPRERREVRRARRQHGGRHHRLARSVSTKSESTAERHGIGLVWSPNFSIGVNVFKRLVAEAARLLADQPEYGAWAWEIHHATKKDSPSGTLLKLVETMRQAGYERSIDAVGSRAGAHPGTHEIGFDSAADTITLRHSARNREGFARGALHAAKWIIGKKGIHEFGEALL